MPDCLGKAARGKSFQPPSFSTPRHQHATAGSSGGLAVRRHRATAASTVIFIASLVPITLYHCPKRLSVISTPCLIVKYTLSCRVSQQNNFGGLERGLDGLLSDYGARGYL